MLAIVAGDRDRHKFAWTNAGGSDQREVLRMRQAVVFNKQPLPGSDHPIEMGLMQHMSSGA